MISAFGDIGSLGSPPRQVVYPFGNMVPTWVTAFHFLAGNREAELKFTTFSPLYFPCFHVLLLLTPSDILPLSATCWGYSLIII